MPPNDRAILFYDGDCGLCNRSVRFLIKRDRIDWLRYAPIQGETAATKLDAELRENLSTVIYLRETPDGEEETLLKSDAALNAVIDIRSHWRWLAYPARCLPRGWRDRVYDWVAQNRHRFFGNARCTLPTEEEQARLLN